MTDLKDLDYNKAELAVLSHALKENTKPRAIHVQVGKPPTAFTAAVLSLLQADPLIHVVQMNGKEYFDTETSDLMCIKSRHGIQTHHNQQMLMYEMLQSYSAAPLYVLPNPRHRSSHNHFDDTDPHWRNGSAKSSNCRKDRWKALAKRRSKKHIAINSKRRNR
jgi:hypothetical protein